MASDLVISRFEAKDNVSDEPERVLEAFGDWKLPCAHRQLVNSSFDLRMAVLEQLRIWFIDEKDIIKAFNCGIIDTLVSLFSDAPISQESLALCISSLRTLRRAQRCDYARSRLIEMGLLQLLIRDHLASSPTFELRDATYEVMIEILKTSQGCITAYKLGYLNVLPTLLSSGTINNKTLLFKLLTNLTLDGSSNSAEISDTFTSLTSHYLPEPASYSEAFLSFIAAVASRSDTGKRNLLPMLPFIIPLALTADNLAAWKFLASIAPLAAARIEIFNLGGVSSIIDSLSTRNFQVQRFILVTITALAEYPPARVALSPAVADVKRCLEISTLKSFAQRSLNQLLWEPWKL